MVHGKKHASFRMSREIWSYLLLQLTIRYNKQPWTIHRFILSYLNGQGAASRAQNRSKVLAGPMCEVILMNPHDHLCSQSKRASLRHRDPCAIFRSLYTFFLIWFSNNLKYLTVTELNKPWTKGNPEICFCADVTKNCMYSETIALIICHDILI